MTWMMTHGIASCIRVTDPEGIEWTAINMSSGIRWHIGGNIEVRSPRLPQWVIDRTNRRFSEVSAILPLHKRSDYCTYTPFEIKEDDEQ